jgi:hypothetical protein
VPLRARTSLSSLELVSAEQMRAAALCKSGECEHEGGMRKIFRLRNFFFVLVALIIGYCINFTYRLNNVCAPGDHILLSDADAIKQAKIRLHSARYGSHGVYGYIDEEPERVDFSHTANCCKATRSRTMFGVIVWQVYLDGVTIGEPRMREVGVDMKLSNCGAVFHDSFITADPPGDSYSRLGMRP